MLGMSSYAQHYIDACRSRVDSDLRAYRNLMAAARNQPASDHLDDAIEAFEETFFNNMALLLDYFFVHRLRGVEGKDGNPLNEVRVLSNSMLQNESILSTSYSMSMPSSLGDKSIKLSPEESVLKHQLGDEIKLTESDFVRLSEAFFEEIQRKFAGVNS